MSSYRPINIRFAHLLMLLSLLAVSIAHTALAQEVSSTEEPAANSINPNDPVLFEAYREGNWDIYAIHADGTNEHSIGRRLGLPGGPALLSPDRRLIVLDTGGRLSLLNPTGTELRWLANVPISLYDMTWLPDSKHIGFATYDGEGSNIYVLNIESLQGARLTPDDGTFNSGPLWSPNGEKIAFTSSRDSVSNLYVMNADGSGVRQITDDTDSYVSYTWLPDSQEIIFSSNRDGELNLYRMNLSTEAVEQLTFTGANYDPVWSPDGTKMVFTSTGHDGDESGIPDLYTMDASGSSIKRLTDTASENLNFICPMWTPDSQKIVVLGGMPSPDNTYPAPDLRVGYEEYNVFIIDANGGGVKALTMDSNTDTIGNCLNLRG